ncbi:ABC transporter permease [Stackebrandtia soli]|uniref:ABC transporter permease n=1 Tax=Stackebrandtia soli TaxID=1892856 RepID=UPI0039E812D1
MNMMLALSRAGFRRFATYRQATLASCVTNTVFGCMRTFVLLAVAGSAGVAAGYTGPQLSTYVWIGQGLIGVVALWGWTELSERVRTGEVAADLLRPVNPVWTYLGIDLGRAAFALLTRMAVPIAVGALFFPFYWPQRVWTYPLFAVSVVLAVLVCFGLRYMLNATAFWLLDVRGVLMLWAIASGVGSGLYFPLGFMPEPIAFFLQYATPFPSILQMPADVGVELGGVADQLGRVAVQALWAAACLGGAFWVQSRATRKLVIQGG